MTILITRPLAAAKRMEHGFQSAGFDTWIDPVLTITPLPAQIDPHAYDAVVTTSANGIESFAALTQHRETPIFCAGRASAATARELGFRSIFYPDIPGGRELITLAKQSLHKRFAYIRGEVIKVDMAKALRETGSHVDTYITYKTTPTTAWSDETIALFQSQKITAITFYSEHSACVTLDLLPRHDLLRYTPSITALCLSDAIAEVIRDMVWKNIEIPT